MCSNRMDNLFGKEGVGMSWRYREPQRSHYDTEEEYEEACDNYWEAVDNYCDSLDDDRC